MAVLTWNAPGTRLYETGIDRVVLYPSFASPAVWSGVVSIQEKIVGGDVRPYYMEGIKQIDIAENTDFQAVVKAYSAPAEFRRCEGRWEAMKGLILTQQPRSFFGLSYRTLRNNDVSSAGYKIHLVYNCKATSANRNNQTLDDSADPMVLEWTIDTIPPASSVVRPTAHLVIDSTKFTNAKITTLENLLYGTASTLPVLPTQTSVASILGGP